jgi:undecaprenyl-diphosphatase
MALGWLLSADLYTFSVINHFAGQNFYLDKTAVFFAEYLIAVFLLLILIEFKNLKAIYNSIIAVLVSLGFNCLVHLFYFRPRPFVTYQVSLLIGHIGDASFPSGHATAAFALAMCIFLYNRKSGILAFLMAFLISISRVFCGVHYPIDVITGAFIGVASSYLIYKIFQKDIKFLRWLQ